MSTIKTIVIVGGGTAGWMSAAALSTRYANAKLNIVLVESEVLGTVGVGESTIPAIRDFNRFLGIDEAEFINATQATFKLGIEFNDWGALGNKYIHPFGQTGHDISGVEFQHYWLMLRAAGDLTPYDNYSLSAVAAKMGKFSVPSNNPDSILSSFNYAYQFDAALYAKYLRELSERQGVVRIEGVVNETLLNHDTGFVESLRLTSGELVAGDFFIDCTGFKGLVVNKALKVGFSDWSEWLPCDRAIAIACEKTDIVRPYTRATAHGAGWQWRIPLQHRTGNGCVYASDFMSSDEATAILYSQLDGKPLAEPKYFSFKAGQRHVSWEKNCVAIGLAGGFLEPLESTSIYLIQFAIQKFIDLFPANFPYRINATEFNRLLSAEYTKIRDFIILHYTETSRDDTEFWRYCNNITQPVSLLERQTVFKTSAHIDHTQYGAYAAVCIGQGITPQSFDSRVTQYPITKIREYVRGIQEDVMSAALAMPSAEDVLHSVKLAKGNGG